MSCLILQGVLLLSRPAMVKDNQRTGSLSATSVLTAFGAGLERCQALLSLDVTGNQLTSLEGVQGCLLLERLNAAHNGLRELTWHHLPQLALGALDLSSNRCTLAQAAAYGMRM